MLAVHPLSCATKFRSSWLQSTAPLKGVRECGTYQYSGGNGGEAGGSTPRARLVKRLSPPESDRWNCPRIGRLSGSAHEEQYIRELTLVLHQAIDLLTPHPLAPPLRHVTSDRSPEYNPSVGGRSKVSLNNRELALNNHRPKWTVEVPDRISATAEAYWPTILARFRPNLEVP
ncbi:hypothetical protein R1flu_001788 [Riccia fluitans]|uniref:Uncharacterized protein n=1 Tax=Riccia fluitans TaxID=41844 RepID=A0ABD1Y489_9MARC